MCIEHRRKIWPSRSWLALPHLHTATLWQDSNPGLSEWGLRSNHHAFHAVVHIGKQASESYRSLARPAEAI